MPSSPIIDVAQAVVDAINVSTFSQPVVAIRGYQVSYDLEDLKALRVMVVPKGVVHAISTRAGVQTDIQIDIGIHKKTDIGLASLDSLMGLVEEISVALRVPQLFGVFTWVETQNTPIYSPDHLDQAKEFLSILTLTFRAVVPR